MASKKQWSELTSAEKAGVLALVAVQAVLAAWCQRDLSSREPSEVRGPKLLWRFASLNTLGAVSYLALGRLPRR